LADSLSVFVRDSYFYYRFRRAGAAAVDIDEFRRDRDISARYDILDRRGEPAEPKRSQSGASRLKVLAGENPMESKKWMSFQSFHSTRV